MLALLAIRSSGCVQNLGIRWLMSIIPPFTIVTLTVNCPYGRFRSSRNTNSRPLVLL